MSSTIINLPPIASARAQAHKSLRRHFETSNYDQAILEIKETIQQFGPHIGLLLDFASAAYLANKHSLCLIATEEAHRIFTEIKDLLSDRSYQKSCLALGKLLEEMGQIAEAIELYELALTNRAFDKLLNFEFYQKIQVQRLRLMTFAGKSEKVHRLYNECFNFITSDQSFRVQLIHGLMLSEVYIFDLETGLARLKKLNLAELPNEDRNLLYFDLLEEFLRRGQNMNLIPSPIQISSLNTFESSLLVIAKTSRLTITPEILNSWKASCTPLCFLKLLSLAYFKTKHPELRRRLMFEINGTSYQSQKVLKKIWAKTLEENQEMIFKVGISELSLNHIQMPLRANSFDSKMLECLCMSREFQIQDLVHKIYDTQECDIYTLEKLRIAILRLNQKIENKFHIPQALKMSKECVLTKEGVKFERK